MFWSSLTAPTMQTSPDALGLAAWRAFHAAPTPIEAFDGLARLLGRHLPLERLVLRRVGLGGHQPARLLTIHVSPPAAASAASDRPEEREVHVPKTRLRAVQEWCGGGRPGQWRDGEAHPEGIEPLFLGLDAELASGTEGRTALALPLSTRHGELGVAILLGSPDARWSAAHRQAATHAAEPLAAAFDAALRAEELRGLRDAAEAERSNLLRRLGRSEERDDEIVGAQGGLAPVMQRVDLVARSDAPVLILGETGAGKEVIARAIHERSPRRDGPCLRVNCGAIPPELVDSELFGHERGAFTGAISERRGWFERADRGTLFLDEVGDLPPAAQVRLLRVMQEGVLERVGGERPIRVDVRIVAATHRDLPGMTRTGRFREDLWYRLAVFPILLPPLRERRGDIAPLAGHFARRSARRLGVHEVAPSDADVRLLSAYHWPGNVRELASVMDRAVILGAGESLEVRQALGADAVGPAARRDEEPPHAAAPAGDGREGLALDDAMRDHIKRVLAIAKGRIEGPRGAARLLAINPHTLRARMRKLGVRWAAFRPEE